MNKWLKYEQLIFLHFYFLEKLNLFLPHFFVLSLRIPLYREAKLQETYILGKKSGTYYFENVTPNNNFIDLTQKLADHTTKCYFEHKEAI